MVYAIVESGGRQYRAEVGKTIDDDYAVGDNIKLGTFRPGDRVNAFLENLENVGAKQAIVGFKVLESKETPGLGDKVEIEPHFLANFEALDARLNDEGTALANSIVTVKQGEKTEPWQIDGLAGATLTANGVTNLGQFWLGENGFQPFLSNLKTGEA